MRKSLFIGTAITAIAFTGASAEEKSYYISGSVGANWASDSDNEGSFTDDFTIAGTALDGATLPAGTAVGWDTEFDVGYTLSAAIGKDLGAFRAEAEVAFTQNDVDTHSGVFAGTTSLDPVDATVLVASTSDDLGTTVGALVADGQGDLQTTYLFANGYYDFELPNTSIEPYIGAGIGVGFVDVEYAPSNVGIVDDDDTVFAYQFMAGAAVPVTPQLMGFGEDGYRGTTDVEVDVDLFAGELEIENRGVIAEVGLRYNFGG